jgi:hypothetical protein
MSHHIVLVVISVVLVSAYISSADKDKPSVCEIKAQRAQSGPFACRYRMDVKTFVGSWLFRCLNPWIPVVLRYLSEPPGWYKHTSRQNSNYLSEPCSVCADDHQVSCQPMFRLASAVSSMLMYAREGHTVSCSFDCVSCLWSAVIVTAVITIWPYISMHRVCRWNNVNPGPFRSFVMLSLWLISSCLLSIGR